MIKVGLIDDNYFLSKHYKQFLEDFPDISIVFSYPSMEALIKSRQIGIRTALPDVVLMDLDHPCQPEAVSIQELLGYFPDSRIIILSSQDDQQYIVQILRSGASGFLLKDPQPRELYHFVHDACYAGACLSPRVARCLIDHLRGDVVANLAGRLTRREIELVNLLKEGLSYKEMAGRLFVSVYTINHHLKNIYQKLGVASKSQLISRLYRKTI